MTEQIDQGDVRLLRYMEIHRYEGDTELHLYSFNVIKRTPKGYWIDCFGGKRFVLEKGTKRYAVADEATALNDFIERKKRHVDILCAQLLKAQRALRIGKETQNERTR